MSPDRGGVFDVLLRMARSGSMGRSPVTGGTCRGSTTPLDAGFVFEHPQWAGAAEDLVHRGAHARPLVLTGASG